MPPEHFCDIQSRRDFFRNCVGGIGAIALWSLLPLSIALTSCTTVQETTAESEPWDFGYVATRPLTDRDAIALITRILDATAPEHRRTVVHRLTNELVTPRIFAVNVIWEALVKEVKIEGYNARPLIDSFICSNFMRYKIKEPSDPTKRYEFADKNDMGGAEYKNYCRMAISLPVVDPATNIGLVCVRYNCGVRAASEEIYAFRFEGDKFVKLAEMTLWVS